MVFANYGLHATVSRPYQPLPAFSDNYMLHIVDKSGRNDVLNLKVDGILNASSLPVLKKVIEKALLEKKQIRLQLSGLIHCDRCGIEFLRHYRHKIDLYGMSDFLKMETSSFSKK
ncbi:MAG: hypothetical protein R6U50_09340 [Desulfobacterales bacterium]